jgi:hypothetical protein
MLLGILKSKLLHVEGTTHCVLRISFLEAGTHSKGCIWYGLPAQRFQAININYFLDTGFHSYLLKLYFFLHLLEMEDLK